MREELEARIGRLLRSRELTLATAESCTGGLVADRITNIPGSSEYFAGGVVAYSNDVKVAILGVSADTLFAHGAVSRETVLEMARGARRILNADVAVSISGIAGPGGGLPNKPVGTTWIGLVTSDGEWTHSRQFEGDRMENKAASAEVALQILADYLERNQS